jgi:plastocyanin
MVSRKYILLATISAILVVGAISVISLNGSSIAFAEKEDMNAAQGSMMSEDHGAALGTISSIQNDDKGQPAWVAAGGWKLFVMPPESNSTKAPDAKFTARFTMTKLDGTSKHMHQISDFVLMNMSDDGNTTTLTGTATMTMKDAPQKNIPITIKIIGQNVISITLNPTVNAHLGNTPLYGTILRANNAYHSFAHGGNMGIAMVDNSHKQEQEKPGKPSSSPAAGANEEGHMTIEIVSGAANTPDKAFSPNPTTIKAGTEVTWKNDDTALHTVTSGKNSQPDNVFDSKYMSPKKEFSFKFEKAGTYDYFCQLHPAMVGKVVVE